MQNLKRINYQRITNCGFFVIAILFFLSFQSDTPKNNGAVGDVKYSILSPKQFEDQNGNGWVLLDGGLTTKELFASSYLHTVLNIPSLPDARGVFLRGVNVGRDVNTGNPDGDQPVGFNQMDAIKNHLHGIKNLHGGINAVGGTSFGISILNKTDPGYPRFSTDLTESDLYDALNQQSLPFSIETRPRNIGLYIYIKIN